MHHACIDIGQDIYSWIYMYNYCYLQSKKSVLFLVYNLCLSIERDLHFQNLNKIRRSDNAKKFKEFLKGVSKKNFQDFFWILELFDKIWQ